MKRRQFTYVRTANTLLKSVPAPESEGSIFPYPGDTKLRTSTRKFRPENIEYLAAKLAKPDTIITSQII